MKRKKAKKQKSMSDWKPPILRKKCDKLWSRAVRHDWAWKCAVCGKPADDAHHMISRGNFATRFELENGVALCTYHHIWCGEVSAHKNPESFKELVAKRYPARWEWFQEHRYDKSTGTKNAAYYCSVIRRLKQYVDPSEYESVVGVRFAAWLDETSVDDED